MPIRALIADGVFPGVEAVLRPLVSALDLDLTVATTAEEARALLTQTDLLILKNFALGAGDIETANALRGVQKLGLLTESLDILALKRRGIPIRTLRLPSSIAVADHTLALLLALSRQLEAGRLAMSRPSQVQAIKTDESHFAYNWAGLPTTALAGKSLGLIGFGEVALEVARRARAFGMRVRYTKRVPLPAAIERRLGVQFSPFESLLTQSDVVSVHIPHTSKTEGLIGAGQLASMKSGALLINTARGAIVDETALIESLTSGHLGGAGLDVFAVEPLPNYSPLLTAPRTVLSPHVAGAGAGALAVAIAGRLLTWRRTLVPHG
jgi:phosphoglycerate dehydrogenase-like enzyme